MMWFMLGALFLNPMLQQAPPAAPPGAQPPAAAAPAQAKELSGPMRIELIAIGDSRVRFWNENFAKTANPGMRMRCMLTGERLPEAVRLGRLILEKVTDDTGKNYVDAAKIDAEARTATNPVSMNKQMLAQGGIDLYTDLEASPRKATKFTQISGFANVVLGAEPSSVTLRNATSLEGKSLDNAELAAAGIKVRVVPTAEQTEQGQERGLALQFESGDAKVKSVDYYDEWFRRMPSRSRPGKTKDGKPYTFYPLLSGNLSEDSSMVIEFFQKAETIKVPLELKDVEMP